MIAEHFTAAYVVVLLGYIFYRYSRLCSYKHWYKSSDWYKANFDITLFRI